MNTIPALQPRGIRNKNPGNIRWNSLNNWVGQVGRDDAGYAVFSDAKWGIRAMGKVLESYHRNGTLSIRQIITRWAPAADRNDTEAYIRHVTKALKKPEHFIPVKQEGDYLALVKVIIQHENGTNPYSDEFITEALALA